jgi:hypothetical protein
VPVLTLAAGLLAFDPFFATWFSFQLFELANPDIAKPDGVAVVHEYQWQLVCVLAVGRGSVKERVALDFGMILDQDSVVQHGHKPRFEDLAGNPRPIRAHFLVESGPT